MNIAGRKIRIRYDGGHTNTGTVLSIDRDNNLLVEFDRSKMGPHEWNEIVNVKTNSAEYRIDIEPLP